MRTLAIAIVLGATALSLPSRGDELPLEPHAQAARELLQTMNVEKSMAAGAEVMAKMLIQANPTLGPYKDVILK